MNYFSIITLLRQSFSQWLSDKCPRMGAALAFYSALSLGPLLIIIIAIGGLFWTKDMLSQHLIDEIGDLMGKDSADMITMVIAHSRQQKEGIIASVIGMVVLFIGASGVFGELQDALNTIWQIPPKASEPFYRAIKDRFFSFAMVMGTGFLLLISLAITTVLNIADKYIGTRVSILSDIMTTLNGIISFAVSVVLFALIFKTIPDIRIKWRDVWGGAVITALLFAIGKYLIGLYLGHSAIGSTYGAAGSFVVFLVWIYYSAQILYFGAEITKLEADKTHELPSP